MKIDSLEKQILELRAEIQQKLLEHLDYHRENESKWGLVKTMCEHPFKTLFAGMLLGLAMVGLVKIESLISLIMGLF